MVTLESHGRAGHVQAPDSSALDSYFVRGLVEALDQIVNPATQRERVVLAQALQMTHFKAVRLEHRDHGAHFLQLPVGEDVALDELATVLRGSAHTDGDLKSGD
jgi:hypothetical protein